MDSKVFVYKHFGALMLGSFFASTLSGAVFVQAAIYLRLFHRDPWQHKLLVTTVAAIDILHTSLIWSSMWDYMIATFGQIDSITFIYWGISISVAVTAILTICVHMFYAYRIWRLSNKNLLITAPIILIACLRLASAMATTTQMLKYPTYSEFRDNVQWLFTLGLTLSSIVDILISVSMFFLLKASQKRAPTMVKVIDTLILYVFETGFATTAATIASMICWVAMHDNMAFLALHFVISKLYAISLLVMLNSRESLRKFQSSWTAEGPVIMFGSRGGSGGMNRTSITSRSVEFQPVPLSEGKDTDKAKGLQISVHRSVDVDCDHSGMDSVMDGGLSEPQEVYTSPTFAARHVHSMSPVSPRHQVNHARTWHNLS